MKALLSILTALLAAPIVYAAAERLGWLVKALNHLTHQRAQHE